MPQASTQARPLPRTGRVPSRRCSLNRQSEVILNSQAAMVRKLRPQARDVNQPPEPNRSASADRRRRNVFSGSTLSACRGDRRLVLISGCVKVFGHAATSCMRRKAIIGGHARLPNQTRVCRCVCGGFARPRRRLDTGLSLAGMRSPALRPANATGGATRPAAPIWP